MFAVLPPRRFTSFQSKVYTFFHCSKSFLSLYKSQLGSSNRHGSEHRSHSLNTRVYISGLRGDHTLETGLAYYYRGHYVYSFPGGTLIEPIPCSIKKGIMVHGMVSPSATTLRRE
jgi:hypothetical protein